MAFVIEAEGKMLKFTATGADTVAIHMSDLRMRIASDGNLLCMDKNTGQTIVGGAFGDYTTPSGASAIAVMDLIGALVTV
jgi:hypothetical protein